MGNTAPGRVTIPIDQRFLHDLRSLKSSVKIF